MTITLANTRHAIATCGACNGLGVRRIPIADMNFKEGVRMVVLDCHHCHRTGIRREQVFDAAYHRRQRNKKAKPL